MSEPSIRRSSWSPIPNFTRLRVTVSEAIRGFRRHNVPRLGAALAFYTLLSLSPMFLILLTVVGMAFGADAARGSMSDQLESVVGPDAGRAIEALIANAQDPARNWSTLIGSLVLIVGATGVFVELKESLDTIWEYQAPPSRGWGLRGLLRDRILAFTAIGGLTFLLLVSLLASVILDLLGDQLARFSTLQSTYARIGNLVLSSGFTLLLFAMIFKLLPARRPPWHRIWFGAAVTTVLFLIGKSLISLYLSRAAVGSPYGAAGSLVVLMVWVYYSTQILFFGAELTRAWTPQSVEPQTRSATSSSSANAP